MTNSWSQRIDSFTSVFENAFSKTSGKPPNREGNSSVDEGTLTKRSSDAQSIRSQNHSISHVSSVEAKQNDQIVDSQIKDEEDEDDDHSGEWAVKGHQKRYFGFIRSPRFWVAFVVGQILSSCLTCTNSMTTGMGNEGTSFPLFQNLLNYALSAIVHTSIMWYKYGFKKWFKILIYDSWRFFISAFIDVQGNYFVVLAYEYTNISSAALLDNFAIVVVVILSFVFSHVRYHWSQYIGILVTIGGMALLIVSDRITGKDYSAPDVVKGDSFVLLGAACYGFSNTFEEFLVSERPLYEVLGNMGFWATCINGVQLAIFERSKVRNAHWNGKVGGYSTGYTLTMFSLYHLAPFMFRISSAAFYNSNVLTSDFWSLLVGTEAFGYRVYWLYPVGFVFTVLGIVCYCAAPMSKLGESIKPWLGENQERGIDGLGTAKQSQLRQRHDHERQDDASTSSQNGAEHQAQDHDHGHGHDDDSVQPRKSSAASFTTPV